MTVDEYFTTTPETTTPMELVFGVLRVAEAGLSDWEQRHEAGRGTLIRVGQS